MMCERHREDLQALVLPGCPFWCLVAVLPPMAWHPLRDGLRERRPGWPTVADVTRMYQRGELAAFHGLGPRRLAAIGQFLTQAGLLAPTAIPGVTWLMTAVLNVLRAASHPMTAREVAGRLDLPSPVKPRTVAMTLKALHDAGLASRERDPARRRWSYQAASRPAAWLPPGLSPLSRAVLAVLWQAPHPLTIAELTGQLTGHLAGLPVSPYDTVAVLLESLHAQELIHRCHDGRSWRYTTARHPANPPGVTLVLPADLGHDGVLRGLVDAIGQARTDLAERAEAFQHHTRHHTADGDPLQQGLAHGLSLASQYAVTAIDEAITAAFGLWDQYAAQPGIADETSPPMPGT
jgi:predicted transcriptional regulator